ncbi:MAG: glycerol-3-phosphate responsive antiterminator [Thermoanaerobacteraceae bacterium]
MKKIVMDAIKKFPIIAAVRNSSDLEAVFSSNAEVVFLLFSDILNLNETINYIKSKNKIVLVHFDLVEGLGKDSKAVEFLAEKSKPHGVISTRSNIILHAKQFGLFGIQRLFLLDSQALNTGLSTTKQMGPDAIEIMPGIIPSMIKEISADVHQPVIAGGLVKTKEEVINAIKSGAVAVSTSKKELWFIE